MKQTNGKKVTMATIKSFINREKKNNNLYIKPLSSFDGMIDMVRDYEDTTFSKVEESELSSKNTLGIKNAWFVGSSRDYFSDYNDDNFVGYHIYNCCGSFILAMHK